MVDAVKLDCEVPVIRKSATILIVEDSRTQAELLKGMLERHGYVALVADNGRQALELLELTRPDAIVSDVVMPVMDGYEFCRAVKSNGKYSSIPLILLTMLNDSKDIIYALVSGADTFITKPCQEDYLILRLERALSGTGLSCTNDGPEFPVELDLWGKKFTVTHSRRHIIEFLISAYDAAIIQHQEVLDSQARLSEANEEANLYLDIITHDINNVNTGAMALAELLLMKTPEPQKALALRLFNCIGQSTEIIGNVSTIRKLHEKKEAIGEVDLDAVICDRIRRFSTNRIQYSGTKCRVLADNLLGQVFDNLFGNSIKFAGARAEIEVSVADRGNSVEIIIADNGPGIPEDMKPVVFDRFRKGKNPRSGTGLGLFITRKLVESYGGTIWAGDRLTGTPSEGAAIHFTLQKAG